MGSKNGLSGNRTTRKGAMCQWQMFSTNRSEAKMRECKAYSNPAFEKLTDKYARVHIDTGGSV